VFHAQKYANDIARREARDAFRIAEERKKRNYADFWTPIPPTEPFRVVLSQVCGVISQGPRRRPHLRLAHIASARQLGRPYGQ
jgi:hypothetical protein